MATASPTKFHLSLNAADLNRSVAFYRTLFGCEPAKQRADYAKFELADPPVVLSLEPHAHDGRGALNHLGIRLSAAAALVEMQQRLELAGLSSQREQGVECCYARQTKFWLHDPDGNLWEFYVLEGDIEHRGAGQLPEQVAPAEVLTLSESPNNEWEHRLGSPFPARLSFADCALREVRLRGTFNMRGLETASVLSEAHRVLDAGGQLLVHCLTSDSPATDDLSLPGPAAIVENVPVDRELVAALESAGFEAIELTKFGASPCFRVNGTEMRETMLRAVKSAGNDAPGTHFAIYRGPFREIVDDAGRTWRRGERQLVPEAVWRMLQGPAFSSHFTCLSVPTPEPAACAVGGN
jgi:catechol 2,3-dioxygenase-like lactoylglutathione lyase family enzyme